MAVNAPAAVFLGGQIDLIRYVHIQILYLAAALTDEMIMQAGVCVEALRAAAAIEAADLPQISQKVQIAVYGSQTDIGKILAHTGVYAVCGRMVVPVHQAVQNGIPLTAVF